MTNKQDKIVGHYTMKDGSHKPLYESEAAELLKHCEEIEQKQACDMPTVDDAIKTMQSAYNRLRNLGWKEIIYCPKDGTIFDVIEAGSTGIFDCHYEGEWPKGSWWVHDNEDLYPARPTLFRLKETNNEN